MNSQTQGDDAGLGASLTDREVLAAWRREFRAESLRPILDRYGALVFSAACRRTGNTEAASEVTRAVFLVLARRAHRLRKAVLAGWLFQIVALTCQRRLGRRQRLWHWISRFTRPSAPAVEGSIWLQAAPKIDHALDRISSRQRNAILLCAFLKHDVASAARILRVSEPRVHQRLQRGLQKIAKRMRLRLASVAAGDLLAACAAGGCSTPLPEPLSAEILRAIEATRDKRPSLKLARRTLRTLAWRRWFRRGLLSASAFGVLLVIAVSVLWHYPPTGRTWLFSKSQIWGAWYWQVAMAKPAQPWPTHAGAPRLDARLIQNAAQLYQTTNIWPVHLAFTREQWQALEPKRISLLANFILPDNRIVLRNPEARRSGALGVIGYEYEWSQAQCEFGSVSFTNAATRVKGNIASFWHKRPFKLKLNKTAPGQRLGGLKELAFDNLVFDHSCLGEALAYEFFRDAGVPAPRTAYAWLEVSVAQRWAHQPFGLYLMEEVVDGDFTAERFGSRQTPLFKPSTYHVFEFLGDNWLDYAPSYDLKTEATSQERERLIEFARLVTSASDPDFAKQVGGFLDLDEFARFLAVEVLLPNYDSILTTGQNYYLYLDPSTKKFGFIPWDLDSAWGNFWVGTRDEQQDASIWRPWVGENRFLERVMAVEEYRRLYRAHLEDFVARLYVPERLNQRIDAITATIHEPLASESPYRLEKFEQTVGLKPVAPVRGWRIGIHYPVPFPDFFPANDLKQFIAGRAQSVRSQLAGETPGIILKHPKLW